VVPFDEYGLPVQVTNELRKTVKFSTNLDEAIQQLKMINIEELQITEIEKEFVMNVQKYL
jgi:exosome complex RNA-binding protein Rrp42 (RNase PH superfamily)